jgi:hypothetical protein
MKAWKVLLRKYNNELISIVRGGKCCVEYREGVYVEPPKFLLDHGFGLTCFRTRKAARKTRKEFCWGGIIRRVEFEKDGIMPIPAFQINILEAEGNGIYKEYGSNSLWPVDTIMVKKMKLLKR